ncbi:phytanoyl-CoA dioxygenase family protein [Curtobacterium sp. ISL-83]|uniref:phytanoyl-CoA dioxygenase family protein n=1 Tax=Curtobacterium sp. ISL-83 TaxID=2819145 RepID=UPI001BE62664|nr:phytanoyl-CoA dioxygenase family protein [Curtobacterium sp. ISL-83]MBT2503545.1 phytanoyl-CoA dioxygenase family protein [Curtobacterium sp. ISL-83]
MTSLVTENRPHEFPIPAGASEEAVRWIEGIYGDGTIAKKGAFSREWTVDMAEDVYKAFHQALRYPRGAVGRGRRRFYVEIHPEQLRGFVDLVDHPWVRGVSEAVLGPDYQIVELGFDIPFPGALDQPWHRDFRMPDETKRTGRLTSLAFNLTAVDTVDAMGPFEIAPGTQFDQSDAFDHEMFPAKDLWPRYEERAVRKYPEMGDISARSALTIHHGTKNTSSEPRPVLVLGIDAPGAGNADHHDMAVTRAFYDALPERVRAHLSCPIVPELQQIEQKHDIEGLMMGDA